jgi:hypothetical protein
MLLITDVAVTGGSFITVTCQAGHGGLGANALAGYTILVGWV